MQPMSQFQKKSGLKSLNPQTLLSLKASFSFISHRHSLHYKHSEVLSNQVHIIWVNKRWSHISQDLTNE